MLGILDVISDQGDRKENLDRYGHIDKNNWSFSYLLDGFEVVTPHYVDELVTGFKKIENLSIELSLSDLVNELSVIISSMNSIKGKASGVLVACADKKASIFFAGDTRAYLLNSNVRTVDHSVAQTLVTDGKIRPETLLRHPYRKYLTKKLQKGSDIEELDRIDLDEIEDIILCTDGIWSCIEEDEYFFQVAKSEGGIRQIYEEAKQRKEKKDNMTIMHLKNK